MCPMCKYEPETIKHFLLTCSHFQSKRDKFFEDIAAISPSMQNESLEYQLKYILDLQCPYEATSICCKFVSDIYEVREGLS